MRKPARAAAGLDCLFIHAGRSFSGRRDLLLMPAGLVPLADALEHAGFRTRVLNLPLKQLENPGFSLASFLRESRPALVCLPLHWHAQSPGVAALARQVRRHLPAASIVLGGITASFFAEEVLAEIPEADFVIKGDGERPLTELARALLSGDKRLGAVPNLLWREGGKVIHGVKRYAAGSRDMDGLDFSRLDLILNKDFCLKDIWRTGPRLAAFEDGPKVYYVAGRGCDSNCSFCGGGSRAQAAIAGRRSVVFRSAEKAAADLAAFSRQGVDKVHFCFDPLRAAEYYPRLFGLLRRRGLKFMAWFECWGLPPESFIAAYAKTFAPGSRLIISPDSGSEEVRRRNRTRYYSNERLLSFAAAAAAAGLRVKACFSTGLPFETGRDFLMTLQLARALKEECGAEVAISGIALEPAAPMFMAPERYGVTAKKRSFRDFMRRTGPDDLGYSTSLLPRARIERNIAKFRALFGGGPG